MDRALAAALEDAIRSACGARFRIGTLSYAAGDPSAARWCVEGTGERFFVKTFAGHGDVFEAEADGLRSIAATGTIRTPHVVTSGSTPASAFLVLEYLDLRPMQGDDGKRCAEAVAALHAIPGTDYGWRRDNYVGKTPQLNTPLGDWPTFFATRRLRPQFEMAALRGYRGTLQAHGERIRDKIPAFFLERRPTPSLLHGDLWSGNIAVLADGTPVVFDPATYHGDRETDFAMCELFGGLPESFYATYRSTAPLAEGYAQRRALYNLYHVLNHLNIFGGGYLREAERMAKAVVDYLRH